MTRRGEEEFCGGRLEWDTVEEERDLGGMEGRGGGGGGRRRTRAVGGACWRIVGIIPTSLCVCILVLVLASSTSCLPLEEGAVGGGGGGPTGGTSEDEEQMMMMRNIEQETGRREREEQAQQLLHKGQLYLPSLFQNQELQDGLSPPSRKTSDYPRYYQREEDALGTEWATVIDPHVYVLNEWVPADDKLQQRKKRSPNAGPSLSITNSLDVLRQRLLLEIARRKMIKSQNQILANAQILKSIG